MLGSPLNSTLERILSFFVVIAFVVFGTLVLLTSDRSIAAYSLSVVMFALGGYVAATGVFRVKRKGKEPI